VYRFLQRLWRNMVDEETGECTWSTTPADDETRGCCTRPSTRCAPRWTRCGFNTAIAKLIELNNKRDEPRRGRRATKLGHGESIAYAPFPEADPDLLVDDTIEIPVMVKGRVRAKIHVPPDTDPAGLEAAAMSDPKVVEFLEGKEVRKVIAVPKKMVNIVI
jgi:leucyl-tRNA synthetase